jgi:RNA polymerase sigma-70 factor (ECF subfamily)
MTGELADRVPLEPAVLIQPVDTGTDSGARVAALFDAHHRRLYALARRMASSADEARDLVQDTFLRVAAAPERVPPGSPHEEAWLVRVLINLCRDRWRRSAVRHRHVETMSTPSSIVDPEPALVAQSVVWHALEQLAPRRRAIVVMYELEDLSPAEIARLLGIAAATVRWHLACGRRELSRIVRGEQPR